MSSKHNHKHNRNARPRVSACYSFHRGYYAHEKSIHFVKLTTCWLGFYLKTKIHVPERIICLKILNDSVYKINYYFETFLIHLYTSVR